MGHQRSYSMRNRPAGGQCRIAAAGVACRITSMGRGERWAFQVMTNIDWQPWVGRTESHRDVVTPTPLAALAAALDRDGPPAAAGDALPRLWHWVYFLPLYRQSQIGADGHAKRGEFCLR